MRLSQKTGVNDVKMCIPNDLGVFLGYVACEHSERYFYHEALRENLIEALPKLNDVRVGVKCS